MAQKNDKGTAFSIDATAHARAYDALRDAWGVERGEIGKGKHPDKLERVGSQIVASLLDRVEAGFIESRNREKCVIIIDISRGASHE